MIRNCSSCFYARIDPSDRSRYVCLGKPPDMIPVSRSKPSSMLIAGARVEAPGELVFQNMNIRVPLDYPGCALWQCRECFAADHVCMFREVDNAPGPDTDC